ncbi:MAG TPA: M15 family metallopeptidase [Rhodothermales bacterium]|nr:M15 family metallopeptidase [Rhodothermales bacterium]
MTWLRNAWLTLVRTVESLHTPRPTPTDEIDPISEWGPAPDPSAPPKIPSTSAETVVGHVFTDEPTPVDKPAHQTPPAITQTLSQRERQRLAQLLPRVRAHVEELIARLNAEGHRVVVVSTLRTPAEQATKLKQGRSATARSWHLCARAVDLACTDEKGIDWDCRRLREGYEAMHRIARSMGFELFGFRTLRSKRGPFTDPFHLQWTDGLTWEKAMAEYKAGRGVG